MNNADIIARNAIIKAAEKDRQTQPVRCHICDERRTPAFVSTIDGRAVCKECVKTEPDW
jgi:formylmethanofuran dehydrogenase subunit E